MFSGRESWVMPVSQRTHRRMSCQIGFQPLLLRRTSATTTYLAAIRIESNQMPDTNVIAIVSFCLITGCRAKVTVVTAGASRQIFMVSNSRTNDVFLASPAGIKGLLIFCQCSILVLSIAKSKNRAEVFADKQV